MTPELDSQKLQETVTGGRATCKFCMSVCTLTVILLSHWCLLKGFVRFLTILGLVSGCTILLLSCCLHHNYSKGRPCQNLRHVAAPTRLALHHKFGQGAFKLYRPQPTFILWAAHLTVSTAMAQICAGSAVAPGLRQLCLHRISVSSRTAGRPRNRTEGRRLSNTANAQGMLPLQGFMIYAA